MPTTQEIVSHKRLKRLYEQKLGKQISSRTWRRRVSEMKQFGNNFSVLKRNATKQVTAFATITRSRGRLFGNNKYHQQRMTAFRYFRNLDSQELNGEEFLQLLAQYLKFDLQTVPKANFYYWFSRCGLKFNSKCKYPISELCFVAYIAALWAVNKREKELGNAVDVTNLMEMS